MPAEILLPNGAGDETALTPIGETANWECVDEESADDTTSYVRNSLAGSGTRTDSYALGPSSIPSGANISIQVGYRVCGLLGEVGSASAGVRLNGSNTMDTAVSITFSFVDHLTANLARPGGGEWAVSDLADLQVRLTLTASAGSRPACTQIYVRVNYDGGPLSGHYRVGLIG